MIVIAGGSGFLGTALTSALRAAGHAVTIFGRGGSTEGRDAGVTHVNWTPDGSSGAWARAIDGASAVVNLAGAGIADRRWSARRKALIRSSRIDSTRSLVAAIREIGNRPPVVIQGSAVGYYGAFDNGPELDETSSPGPDFLGHTCVAWEGEAQPLSAMDCRVVFLRTGIVLSKAGGALPKMMLPFRLFVGGPIGSGRQFMSWIHINDWTAMVLWAIGNPAVNGPLNATAPFPATNADFSRALGRALRRPSWFPVPGFALRLAIGEFAASGLLKGQRVLPNRALELGFTFRYHDLGEAMKAAVA